MKHVWKMLMAALLAVTAVLYIGNGLFARLSGREVGPVIECPEEVLEVSIHDGTQALLAGVTARDDQDGDLTDRVVVTGTVKPIAETLREHGIEHVEDAQVIVGGGQMAAQYALANASMRKAGAQGGFGTVVPRPFIYEQPTSTVSSVTSQNKAE